MPAQHPAEFLRALLEASPLGIIALDSAGQVRLWSRSAERILGWPEEEVLGRPAPAELEIAALSEVESEVRLARRDGSFFDAVLRVAPWRDALGKVQGTVARGDRRQQTPGDGARTGNKRAKTNARRALIHAEGRFRRRLEAAPDAIIQVDRKGHIQLVNRVTEKLFGYEREDLPGPPVELLIPEEVRGRHVHHRDEYGKHPQTRPMGTARRHRAWSGHHQGIGGAARGQHNS
jgi:PAS domain S-box-containing protein